MSNISQKIKKGLWLIHINLSQRNPPTFLILILSLQKLKGMFKKSKMLLTMKEKKWLIKS